MMKSSEALYADARSIAGSWAVGGTSVKALAEEIVRVAEQYAAAGLQIDMLDNNNRVMGSLACSYNGVVKLPNDVIALRVKRAI